jgi:hypothetical protein
MIESQISKLQVPISKQFPNEAQISKFQTIESQISKLQVPISKQFPNEAQISKFQTANK